MGIDAINTLEVRLIEEPDVFFERRLSSYCNRFEAEPGCLGFALSRSGREPHLWLLTGHWSSAAYMTAHFCGETMADLVNTLMALRANVNFASFTKALPETSTDVR